MTPNSYEIQKNVPLYRPSPAAPESSYPEIPLARMVPGDSVFVPLKDYPKRRSKTSVEQRLSQYVYNEAKRLGKTVSLRVRRERPGGMGIRIWVTAPNLERPEH